MMRPSLSVIVGDSLAYADRLRDFQVRLNDMTSDGARKEAILNAKCDGFITHDDTALLFQVYGLVVE